MSHPNGKWDIDPGGVNSVVSKTGGIAQQLEGEAKGYATHLESAAKSAGTLSGGSQSEGLVALALSQFAQATEASLKFVAERSGKSLHGAVDATKAYLNGDLHMAADVQKKALGDATPPAVVLPPQGKQK